MIVHHLFPEFAEHPDTWEITISTSICQYFEQDPKLSQIRNGAIGK
jgi:hypothetical protein